MNYKQFIFENELTISSVSNISSKLFEYLKATKKCELNFSKIEKIDISGLQLLISFLQEVTVLDKELSFIGILNNDFKEDLNRIIFNNINLDTSEDLLQYIKGLI